MASEKKIALLYVGKKLGKVYHGFDDAGSFSIPANTVGRVTESLAQRLLKDFPDEFSKVEEKEGKGK